MNSDKRIKITFENFAKTNEEILSSNKKYIGVFKGRIDQTTGVNWCSDCVAAEEPIRKYLIPIAEKKNITVVEISVGTREEWKNPAHIFRTDKKLQLKKIPTIALITTNGIVERLEEELCLDEEMLKELIHD